MRLSEPPLRTMSASPRAMRRKASPTACVPAAHAVVLEAAVLHREARRAHGKAHRPAHDPDALALTGRHERGNIEIAYFGSDLYRVLRSVKRANRSYPAAAIEAGRPERLLANAIR